MNLTLIFFALLLPVVLADVPAGAQNVEPLDPAAPTPTFSVPPGAAVPADVLSSIFSGITPGTQMFSIPSVPEPGVTPSCTGSLSALCPNSVPNATMTIQTVPNPTDTSLPANTTVSSGTVPTSATQPTRTGTGQPDASPGRSKPPGSALGIVPTLLIGVAVLVGVVVLFDWLLIVI